MRMQVSKKPKNGKGADRLGKQQGQGRANVTDGGQV